VGTGALTAITGFGAPADPVKADVTVFNGGHELIELVSVKGTNTTAGLDRLQIQGRTLVAKPPSTPGGPPDGRTSVQRIELSFPAIRSPQGRAFVTTPPSCPSSGAWTSRASYGFADGGHTMLTSLTPCTRGMARARLRVGFGRYGPTRVRHGRFRLRCRMSGRGRRTCRARALAGRHTIAYGRDKTHGRSKVLTLRLNRRGRRLLARHPRGARIRVRLRASAPGYRSGRASKRFRLRLGRR
jgi:hypothetical protein